MMARAGDAPSAPERRPLAIMAAALGWGGGMAAVRMACSFVSIKVTAVALGPAGLALIAQFSNFVSLFQSMLGQGLTTGIVRLDAEYASDPARRRRLRATAGRMLLVLALLFGAVALVASGPIAGWLLGDRLHAGVIAVSGIAVLAAMLTDLLNGAMNASKEMSLVGTATIVTTVLGLAIFAPCAALWGVAGGLWASVAVLVVSAGVSATLVHLRSRGVRLGDFRGGFDAVECRRLASFYPMLLVNGVLTPLSLILVRDALSGQLGLEAAGLWQACWRLSEAYQAVILSSTTLYFMQSMGEHSGDVPALRRQLLRTLALTTAATAALALAIGALRVPIVHAVLSAQFAPVATMLPLQLVGDVLKMAGWILAMALVATMRSRRYIALTVLSVASLAGLTRLLVPEFGVQAALWSYLATGALQVAFGMLALRDILWTGSGASS